MTDEGRQTETKNIVVRCIRPYKGCGIYRREGEREKEREREGGGREGGRESCLPASPQPISRREELHAYAQMDAASAVSQFLFRSWPYRLTTIHSMAFG